MNPIELSTVPTTPIAIPSRPSPEELRKICEAQDKAREELRKKIGTVNVAVDLVRHGREE